MAYPPVIHQNQNIIATPSAPNTARSMVNEDDMAYYQIP